MSQKNYDYLEVDKFRGFTLVRPTPDDFQFIRALLQNPLVMENQGGVWDDNRLDVFLEFLKKHWNDNGFGHYLIRINGSNVGIASLKLMRVGEASNYDIGFSVLPEEWGKGIATSAARNLITLAFGALGLTEVSALTLESQKAGVSVLKKLGFQENGKSKTNYAGRDWEVIKWLLKRNSYYLLQF